MDSTFAERESIIQNKKDEYSKWNGAWKYVEAHPECKWNKFKSKCHNIEKDVVRTDRTNDFYAGENNENLKKMKDILTTYIYFNSDLGYVQGMNELLSPTLFVMQDEVETYWCFKGIMDIKESNFHKDQNGMHIQLLELSRIIKLMDPALYSYLEKKDCINMFFAFRWILILFKREFSFSTIQRLWEILWTNYLTPNFHLFVAASIIMNHSKDFIEQEMEFDDMVKYVNDLSGKIKLVETLISAEVVYRNFLKLSLQSQINTK